MRTGFRNILASLRRSTSGNATVLVALSMPVLIGAGGMALDTAQWYLWKSEMQHAVDQAALAGAFSLARDSESDEWDDRALQEYNANLGVTTGYTRSTPQVTLANWGDGEENSVRVVASVTHSLPFTSFLLGTGTKVEVAAQASFQMSAEYRACLRATSQTGTGIEIGNNATVKAKCGLAALSSGDPAIEIDDHADVTTDAIYAKGQIDAPESLSSVVHEGVDLSDPYEGLTPPNNATVRGSAGSYCQTTGKGSNKVTTATLNPGTYSSGLATSCTTTLNEGVYVVSGGDLDLSANYDVTGSGVIFVLKNGARLKLGGNGSSTNKLNLSPVTESYLRSINYAHAEEVAGMLIFESPTNSDIPSGHIINGNSRSIIQGTVYLPKNFVKIAGTANVTSQCLQISAYKIKIEGGAKLETLCPTSASAMVGSTEKRVRLVG